VRACSGVEKLECGGFPLGVFTDSRYETGLLTLAPGDLVLFYTDGVVEIDNPDGEQFGIDRLATVLETSRSLPVPEVIEAIVRAGRGHGGNGSFGDDFTVMLLRRLP
jgi:sigma-B regulation protein RsbU (phosphoserine phosphatase)